MLHITYILTWMAAISVMVSQAAEFVNNEYCNMEEFNATCPDNAVILMTRARYGRMRIGRCVKRDLGYVGCSIDVLAYLDQRCSGRRHCQFSIPEPTLYETQPCPEDTTPYLEAAYSCVTVLSPEHESASCVPGHEIPMTAATGYISSAVSMDRGLGTAPCPWEIQAPPGQRINMTIYSFQRAGIGTDSSSAWRSDVCYEYALIKEKGSMKRVTVCGGEQREAHLYLSQTNKVEVQVLGKQALEQLGPFLIQYHILGCPDLTAPKDGYIERTGDNAVIRCNHSSEVWYVTCKGTKWLGQRGNCTVQGGSQASATDTQPDDFPYGILIVVAIGVALGVFIGGVLLLCASFYMKRRTSQRQQAAYHIDSPGTMTRGKMLVEYDPETHTWERGKIVDPTMHHYRHEIDPQQTGYPTEHCTRGHYDGKHGPPPYLGGDTMRPPAFEYGTNPPHRQTVIGDNISNDNF